MSSRAASPVPPRVRPQGEGAVAQTPPATNIKQVMIPLSASARRTLRSRSILPKSVNGNGKGDDKRDGKGDGKGDGNAQRLHEAKTLKAPRSIHIKPVVQPIAASVQHSQNQVPVKVHIAPVRHTPNHIPNHLPNHKPGQVSVAHPVPERSMRASSKSPKSPRVVVVANSAARAPVAKTAIVSHPVAAALQGNHIKPVTPRRTVVKIAPSGAAESKKKSRTNATANAAAVSAASKSEKVLVVVKKPTTIKNTANKTHGGSTARSKTVKSRRVSMPLFTAKRRRDSVEKMKKTVDTMSIAKIREKLVSKGLIKKTSKAPEDILRDIFRNHLLANAVEITGRA